MDDIHGHMAVLQLKRNIPLSQYARFQISFARPSSFNNGSKLFSFSNRSSRPLPFFKNTGSFILLKNPMYV
jgi:hypothetical protein